MIFYEAPHHLRQTLSDFLEAFGDRKLAMGRELTKRHEEMLRMRLSEAIAYYQEQDPRGEYVLILEGADSLVREREERARWEQMTLTEHMALYSELPAERGDEAGGQGSGLQNGMYIRAFFRKSHETGLVRIQCFQMRVWRRQDGGWGSAGMAV